MFFKKTSNDMENSYFDSVSEGMKLIDELMLEAVSGGENFCDSCGDGPGYSGGGGPTGGIKRN